MKTEPLLTCCRAAPSTPPNAHAQLDYRFHSDSFLNGRVLNILFLASHDSLIRYINSIIKKHGVLPAIMKISCSLPPGDDQDSQPKRILQLLVCLMYARTQNHDHAEDGEVSANCCRRRGLSTLMTPGAALLVESCPLGGAAPWKKLTRKVDPLATCWCPGDGAAWQRV